MLGGAVGHAVHTWFPSFTAQPGAYAIVGMAAVFGARAQAPLTAILIIFEMTGDYRIILPLMAATVIAALVYRAFSRDSIYTVKLRRRGIVYRGGQDLDILSSTQVGSALTHPPLCVSPEASIRDFRREAERTRFNWFPVVDAGRHLVGVMTAQDADRAVEDGDEDAPVSSYMTQEVVSVTPRDSLQEAVRGFGVRDLGHLPVVDPQDPRKLVGFISRLHVIRAYKRELQRRQPHG